MIIKGDKSCNIFDCIVKKIQSRLTNTVIEVQRRKSFINVHKWSWVMEDQRVIGQWICLGMAYMPS